MFNFSNLNDVEFEYLCKDIMERKLGMPLQRFAAGRDGGVDLTDDVHRKNVVVQVKHFIRASVSQLISSLHQEVPKVCKMNPGAYYVCCSKEEYVDEHEINVTGSESLVKAFLNEEDVSYEYSQEDRFYENREIENIFSRPIKFGDE